MSREFGIANLTLKKILTKIQNITKTKNKYGY